MGMNNVVEWLLEGPPWVKYRTYIDLIGQPESNSDVANTRKKMLTHPNVHALLTELSRWPGPSLKRHNEAGHLLHKLVFISDIGMVAGDPGINEIIKKPLNKPFVKLFNSLSV